MPPLTGIRVLDLTHVVAGPFCAMLLGDMGAEVLKIENPTAGDDTRAWGPFYQTWSTFFLGLNRSKKSVVLDLKDPGGTAALRNLIGSSDILKSRELSSGKRELSSGKPLEAWFWVRRCLVTEPKAHLLLHQRLRTDRSKE